MVLNTLHEAIIYVLEKQPNRTASFEDISNEIKKRNLWKRPSDNTFPRPFQIRLRATVAKKYKSMFVFIEPDKVRLK